MSSYNSDTELRLVHPNDIYRLAVILDDNDGWKKLMEVIPKDVNKRICTLANKSVGTLNNRDANNRKYDNDHVRLLENAGKRSHESRLFSQILIDEWSVSGKKNQRPTLAHLLKLLLRCHQFRAADFVADYLLKGFLL